MAETILSKEDAIEGKSAPIKAEPESLPLEASNLEEIHSTVEQAKQAIIISVWTVDDKGRLVDPNKEAKREKNELYNYNKEDIMHASFGVINGAKSVEPHINEIEDQLNELIKLAGISIEEISAEQKHLNDTFSNIPNGLKYMRTKEDLLLEKLDSKISKQKREMVQNGEYKSSPYAQYEKLVDDLAAMHCFAPEDIIKAISIRKKFPGHENEKYDEKSAQSSISAMIGILEHDLTPIKADSPKNYLHQFNTKFNLKKDKLGGLLSEKKYKEYRKLLRAIELMDKYGKLEK